MVEKYRPTGTPISDRERELLTLLCEEAAEVTQAATKILRFGKESYPDYGNNQERLALEIGDFNCMVEKLLECQLIKYSYIVKGQDRKEDRMKRFMQNEQEEKNE